MNKTAVQVTTTLKAALQLQNLDASPRSEMTFRDFIVAPDKQTRNTVYLMAFLEQNKKRALLKTNHRMAFQGDMPPPMSPCTNTFFSVPLSLYQHNTRSILHWQPLIPISFPHKFQNLDIHMISSGLNWSHFWRHNGFGGRIKCVDRSLPNWKLKSIRLRFVSLAKNTFADVENELYVGNSQFIVGITIDHHTQWYPPSVVCIVVGNQLHLGSHPVRQKQTRPKNVHFFLNFAGRRMSKPPTKGPQQRSHWFSRAFWTIPKWQCRKQFFDIMKLSGTSAQQLHKNERPRSVRRNKQYETRARSLLQTQLNTFFPHNPVCLAVRLGNNHLTPIHEEPSRNKSLLFHSFTSLVWMCLKRLAYEPSFPSISHPWTDTPPSPSQQNGRKATCSTNSGFAGQVILSIELWPRHADHPRTLSLWRLCLHVSLTTSQLCASAVSWNLDLLECEQ